VVYVVECLPLAERCSDGASEHYYPPLVCPENVYLWFNPVILAKVLTLAFMKELVFQVWKSCFQHAANGYLVMHSPWGIFDIPNAFLDPENVDFDVLYAILLTFWITSLCVLR